MTTETAHQPEAKPDYAQMASIIRTSILEILNDPEACVADIIAEVCERLDLDDDQLDQILKSGISVIVDSKKIQTIAERQKP